MRRPFDVRYVRAYVTAAAVPATMRTSSPLLCAASLAGLLLVPGLLTPLAGALAVLLSFVGLLGHAQSQAGLTFAHALAVALIGPGAYSFDARLFGRRALIFDSSLRN